MVIKTTTEFSNETEAELLEWMALQEEEPEAARAAFAELYNRHIEFVYKKCMCAFRNSCSESDIEDLVHDTFWKVYVKAHTYSHEPTLNPDTVRLRTLAWIFSIAEKMFIDKYYIKGSAEQPISIDSMDYIPDFTSNPLTLIQDSEEQKEEKDHHNQKTDIQLAQEALETLDDRERDIIETYLRFYSIERINQKIPKDIISKICIRWNLQPENVRQIQSRSLRKIKEYISKKKKKG